MSKALDLVNHEVSGRYPLVNIQKNYGKSWKNTIFKLGKSTISSGPCSIAMFVYRKVFKIGAMGFRSRPW
jgi:hypothetical protein